MSNESVKQSIIIGALPLTNKTTMVTYISKLLQDYPIVFKDIQTTETFMHRAHTIKELKALFQQMKQCIREHNQSIISAPSVSKML